MKHQYHPVTFPHQLRDLERHSVSLINIERDRHLGVGFRLYWQEWAALAARRHSADMRARRFFEHRGPEGQHVGDRLSNTGVKYALAAENIAWKWRSDLLRPNQHWLMDIHRQLMVSPGHRENILNPHFLSIGVGLVHWDGNLLVTQIFLSPSNHGHARDPPNPRRIPDGRQT